jgi:ubiquinol-cytochrome c reductase cytochrome b subunit
MDNSKKNSATTGGRLTTRALNWVDERTGIKGVTRKVLDEPIPGGARWAYVFGSGLLFIFLLQLVTGLSLALYYTPTVETAHTSLAYITKQVAGGAFLRSLHSYGSSAMIIVLGLHFLQTFTYGSFKGRRELLWLSGAVLSLLVLGMGFTGYLLPWDQKAYFATAVGTNIAGQVPLAGNLITRLLRGGETLGTLTLSRFYVAHVFLIPAAIIAFIAAHIFLFRKAGPAGPMHEHPVEPKLHPERFYPRQVLFDMAFALLIVGVLAGLAYLRPVTLGPIANPSDSHFLPRPEWYYLPMFQWLKYWEGPGVVIGVVVIPGLVAAGFFLLPFLDRRLERKIWRRPIPALAVAIVVAGMISLGLKSQIDDQRSPVAEQLAHQHEEEKAYSAAPFEPYTSGTGVVQVKTTTTSIVDPLVSKGKDLFTDKGCSACHGDNGVGSALAPSLVGIATKFPKDRLAALLHNPSAKMKAGGMPDVEATPAEMDALIAYLASLGKPADASRTATTAPEPAAHPQETSSDSTLANSSKPKEASPRKGSS